MKQSERDAALTALDGLGGGQLLKHLLVLGRSLQPAECSCWNYTMVGHDKSEYWPADERGRPTGHHPGCELYEPPRTARHGDVKSVAFEWGDVAAKGNLISDGFGNWTGVWGTVHIRERQRNDGSTMATASMRAHPFFDCGEGCDAPWLREHGESIAEAVAGLRSRLEIVRDWATGAVSLPIVPV